MDTTHITIGTIIISLIMAAIVGLIVKILLSFFNQSKPYADPIGLLVAALVFLAGIGVF